jgi:EpsG family
MIYYYLLYIFSFFIALFSIDSKVKLNLFYPILFIFLILFVGLRYNSVDYWGYYRIFLKTDIINFSFPLYSGSGATSGREYVYSTLSAIIRYLGGNFKILIFIIAFFSISIKFKLFFKFSPYPFLSILIYLSTVFVKDLGQIRSALAASILFLAIIPIHKRQFLKFLLLVFIAGGIQVFAFIGLPLYWIARIRGKWNYLFILIAVILGQIGGISHLFITIFQSSNSALATQVSGYIENNNGSTQNSLGLNSIFIVILLLYSTLNIKKLLSHNEYAKELVSYTIIGFLAFQSFIDFPMFADRSVILFSSLPFCILFPSIIKIVDGTMKPIVLLAFFIYCFYFFNNTIVSAMPYEIFF